MIFFLVLYEINFSTKKKSLSLLLFIWIWTILNHYINDRSEGYDSD